MSRFVRIFNVKAFGDRLSVMRPASIQVGFMLLGVADWREGIVTTDQSEIAATLSLSERSVSRALKELSDAGIIARKSSCIAINPEFVWGGRSWNMAKAGYYRITGALPKNVVSLAQSAVIDDEEIENAGREALRNITGRKSKGK
ncbi:helix-turn-helix domain-containing protein [Enterobacteriaceae bacterium LUAb1]